MTAALSDMREADELAWSAIADNTRWVRQQDCWNDVEDFLTDITTMYRRDSWRDQRYRVEVWVESDSIAGFISEITYPLGVPLPGPQGPVLEGALSGTWRSCPIIIGKPIRALRR